MLPRLSWLCLSLLVSVPLCASQAQPPALPGTGAPASKSDRIYCGDQTSNTVTVIRPWDNKVLGTIALGQPRLSSLLNPQYVDRVNSHGLGFSRDGKYIVNLSTTSNTVTVIRTLDNSIVSTTSVGRNAHEAFFSADNRTVWAGTRGVETLAIVDGLKGGVIENIPAPGGPSKVVFSPNSDLAYVNHIRAAYIGIYDVASRKLLRNITGLADTFSSDMMIDATGQRLWVAHKMTGQVSVLSLVTNKVVGILNTGPETNHPNHAIINGIHYGFVTVAAENTTKVYTQNDPEKIPTLVGEIRSSGVEPHGLWPNADNKRMYILNEHSDTVDVADLTSWPFKIIDTMNVGQEGQALVYVSNAVPSGNGTQNLGTQGLTGKPAMNALINVDEGPRETSWENVSSTALITVRPAAGLEMFQIIGRNMELNATYVASASCLHCHGARIPLVEFVASTPVPGMMGCGGAPQTLAFFKFDGVYDIKSVQIHRKQDD
ncbi:40-residue YVTN family beta-propeller repeat protein [Rhizodiscina lignyota]|uniref:40-residue YVTN family beta-propeller repeat protein n=1 Tax=Rhizodiscina lignyota TaxID=1504668 RepID=A0A9P4ICA2_9PEZI|nr:40-residue YVTN family beta-propeller repeat protein [Rhizodiscina lignyota]